MSDIETQRTDGAWDPLIAHLRDLRSTAGDPSYGRIAELVVQERVRCGASPAAAHLARSTVYDLLRMGRARVDLGLVREVGVVLGADRETVESWIDGCASQVVQAVPTAEAEPPPSENLREQLLLCLGCLVLNLVGREFVDYFNLPVYLDMTGTAIAAIALGPWRGAAVGAATNVVGASFSGLISMPFGIVNVVGALVWGYGVRRYGMGRTLLRFFALGVLTAIVCTMVSVPIIVASLHHDLRVGNDVVTQLVSNTVDAFVPAVSLANTLTSMADKLLSSFIALVVISALPWRMRKDVPLVLADHQP
ncbi:MAG TPA: hypothetical protein VF426_03535 [Marmoricola sp.]